MSEAELQRFADIARRKVAKREPRDSPKRTPSGENGNGGQEAERTVWRPRYREENTGGPSFRPDFKTTLGKGLDYFATFSPTVAPYKRITSLDGVRLGSDGFTPELYLKDTPTETLPQVSPGEELPGYARFWGSFEVDFEGSTEVELPSVTPNMVLEDLFVEPEVGLSLERDAAGNVLAVAEDAPPAGAIRISLLVQAPESYFNQPLPPTPISALSAFAPRLPEDLRARAVQLARRIGVTPGMSVAKTLRTLVAHFRAFREDAWRSPRSRDALRDLALGGVGLCRHRAYAFVIIAQALGLPARMATNEAHAFAEVGVGVERVLGAETLRFMRIELGGAARGLIPRGFADVPIYKPHRDDPLPRPPEFVRALQVAQAHMREKLRGQRSGESPDAQGPPTLPVRGIQPGASPFEGRKAARLSAWIAERNLLRGESTEVSGRLRDVSRRLGLAQKRVEIVLHALPSRLLGVTTTGGDGRFRIRVRIPPDTAPGVHDLFVSFPGDVDHKPTQTRPRVQRLP